MLCLEKLIISGGRRLAGEVGVSGAKNAAVAIIPAALLVDGVCRIENLPHIDDVSVIIEILSELGAEITYINPTTIEVNARGMASYTAVHERVRAMRASYYLLGALLGRFKKARVRMPGGCYFGDRPIDQHVKGFKAMGALVDLENGVVDARAERLCGANIYLDMVSVGATINIMIAAACAEGVTTIENAAKEPHVVDLANFLNVMGANIKGAGTDTIKIIGVKKLRGGTYSIIPDQIEAGTLMIAAAATGGDVLIKNVIPKHMESLSAKLIEIGAKVSDLGDAIRVVMDAPPKCANVKTLPYPGFPTDLQPLIVAFLTAAKGTSVVTESVWESRFQYVGELRRMGVDIQVEGRAAVIKGGKGLSGAEVKSTDLRAGAGLIVAALMATGTTRISGLRHIDRGYEEIEKKLCALGADIKRVRGVG